MSTGANCMFVEREQGKWFCRLQKWPYGETEDYEEMGPFDTYQKALEHLGRNRPNPGGHSVSAIPGCPHDLKRPLEECYSDSIYDHRCDRCGAWLKKDGQGY